MKVLKFTLSGKTAFFKKPEVNTYFYFTYGNIHKVAILGIFGAILGYDGYNQMVKDDVYPEFYEKLKEVKISIVPGTKNGYIPKKIQRFNNSVGYASKEQGGNLIVKEQWLENPTWDIYVLINDKETEHLEKAIVNQQCVYIPYLGKNDHPADIKNAIIIENVDSKKHASFIHSFVPKEWIVLDLEDEEEEIDHPFKYEEYLPVSLDSEMNLYQLQNFVYSNMAVIETKCEVIHAEGKNIVFY